MKDANDIIALIQKATDYLTLAALVVPALLELPRFLVDVSCEAVFHGPWTDILQLATLPNTTRLARPVPSLTLDFRTEDFDFPLAL